MKSPDILATDCMREFEAWFAQVSRTGALELLRPAMEVAFIAGYERGGRAGAKMMHEEAVRVVRGDSNQPTGRST